MRVGGRLPDPDELLAALGVINCSNKLVYIDTALNNGAVLEYALNWLEKTHSFDGDIAPVNENILGKQCAALNSPLKKEYSCFRTVYHPDFIELSSSEHLIPSDRPPWISFPLNYCFSIWGAPFNGFRLLKPILP